MSQNFGMWERDCQADEETLDLADRAIADDGVIDLAEYEQLRCRLQALVSRSADRMELITEILATLKNGDDAPRVIRLRGERRQRKGAPLNWRVIEGGKASGEDEPDWAA